MANFGRNIKLSAAHAQRDAIRRFYERGFGCERRSPREDLDQFIFEAGESLGVFYVPAERALGDDAWDAAPWLEFIVDDPEAAKAALVEAGGAVVDFADRSHHYLRGPAGPVFRLAKRA